MDNEPITKEQLRRELDDWAERFKASLMLSIRAELATSTRTEGASDFEQRVHDAIESMGGPPAG